jgi:elongation factor Ts
MDVSASAVKALREETGAGYMDCRRALQAADGDKERAKELLREQGLATAAKKAGREARQGVIETYVHGGRIGVLVEINCETDFVARTEDFRALAKHIAQQIAAMDPKYVSRGDVPEGVETQDGEVLMEQEFIRQSGRTIEDLVKETIAKVGENVVVRRFARYELGA